MKKIILLVLVVGVLVSLVAFFFFGRRDTRTATEPPPPQTPFPVAPTSPKDTPITVRASDGSEQYVRDFRNDEHVAKLPDGSYNITDTGADETTTFNILYYPSDAGFIISLRKEPLGESRLIAENALMKHLGVSHEQLCRLSLVVNVARDVNEFYAGQNLGISNCQGSVPLPE